MTSLKELELVTWIIFVKLCLQFAPYVGLHFSRSQHFFHSMKMNFRTVVNKTSTLCLCCTKVRLSPVTNKHSLSVKVNILSLEILFWNFLSSISRPPTRYVINPRSQLHAIFQEPYPRHYRYGL